MHIESDGKLEKLMSTKVTISENIHLQKEDMAKRGKRWVDFELIVGGSVGLIGWACFRIELYLLEHLLVLLFSVIIITSLYIFRVSKSFTRLEKDLLERIDSKIEALK